ncbi:MAG: dihydrolipoamide dehydrogenase [Gammaproteobacteria bacterium]|jgi:dihydrolipoamide dehydrogenase
MTEFDVIVIGAGPGGYVAAIRCAQLGLKTACVDAWRSDDGKASLGGTCLNVGCIPSKALLDTSHHYHNLQHVLPAHGISVKSASIDVTAMIARKDQVVQNLTRGISGLLRKNKVTSIAGTAQFKDARTVTVALHDGGVGELSAANIIVATGSVPVAIAPAPVDGERIVDNVGALSFREVPKRLGVIGAGVIGLELGSVWARLGAEVVILEAVEDFLPPVDRTIARAALRTLREQGLDIRMGCKVTATSIEDKFVKVSYDDKNGSQALDVDRLVVAVGRRANTAGLAPEAAGLQLDARGCIEVDGNCATTVPGVWAIGDCVLGPMLAHKASEEGVAVAEQIAGQASHINHALVPWVIYTHPEIAWVGKTEDQLKAAGIEYRLGSFPFMAIGRAQGSGETNGMVRMLADAHTDRILGVHIFGANASELIAEAVTAMAFHGSAEDLARTVHAHPTMAEAIHEAALALDKRAIHM